MIGSSAFVRIEGKCRKAGDTSHQAMAVEEFMPFGAFLRARTIQEAAEYFISNTDQVEEIIEVSSLKVDGHELIKTFLS